MSTSTSNFCTEIVKLYFNCQIELNAQCFDRWIPVWEQNCRQGGHFTCLRPCFLLPPLPLLPFSPCPRAMIFDDIDRVIHPDNVLDRVVFDLDAEIRRRGVSAEASSGADMLCPTLPTRDSGQEINHYNPNPKCEPSKKGPINE